MARCNFVLLSLLFLAGSLQAQVDTPNVGVARYSDGSVHSVFGLHANLIVGKQATGPADAISFSNSAGLISKNGRIQLFGPGLKLVTEYDSEETAPLLNVDDDLNTAIAWLPAHHALLRWTGKAFELKEVSPGSFAGQVSSVRLQNPQTAALLVTGSEGAVSEAAVSLETGNLVSFNILPGVTGPAYFQCSYLVFHDERGLEIASRDGAVRTLPLPENDLAFERMSSDWLHISSLRTGQSWILHLSSTKLELSELPTPAKELKQ